MEYQWKSWAKHSVKSGKTQQQIPETQQQVVSYRPLWDNLSLGFARFINGFRPIYRWVSPDLSMGSVRFINGFAQHRQWFRSIFCLISRYVHLVMVFLYQWFGTNNGYISQLCCTLIGWARTTLINFSRHNHMNIYCQNVKKGGWFTFKSLLFLIYKTICLSLYENDNLFDTHPWHTITSEDM